MYARREKCDFRLKEVKFLGHVINKNGVFIDPSKVEAVLSWERPKTVMEIRSFLGLASYYRRFIQGFYQLALPLTRLTWKGKPFIWTPEYEVSFQELKHKLTSALVLVIPDPKKNFVVYSNASKKGLGYILIQERKVVAYASR